MKIETSYDFERAFEHPPGLECRSLVGSHLPLDEVEIEVPEDARRDIFT